MTTRMRLLRDLTKEIRQRHPWLQSSGERIFYHPVTGFAISGLNFDPSSMGEPAVYVRPFLLVPCPPEGTWYLLYGERVQNGIFEWWHLDDPSQFRQLVRILEESTLPMIKQNGNDESALDFINRSRLITRGYDWCNELCMINLSVRRYDVAAYWLGKSRACLDDGIGVGSSGWVKADKFLRDLTGWFDESPERARKEVFACRAEGLRLLKVLDSYIES